MPMGGSEDRAGNGQRLPPAGAVDCRLPRSRRLTHSANFRETYAQGRKGVGRFMVMWLRSGPDAALRLAVVSSRKVGPAVDRNRARRRLREIYRRRRGDLCGEVDLLLVARRSIVDAAWEDVVKDFDTLARRAGLLGRDIPGPAQKTNQPTEP